MDIPDLLWHCNARFLYEFGAITQSAWFCLSSAFAIPPITTIPYFVGAVKDGADKLSGIIL